jgi:glycosyltransferase involved in cell wall biosynthesis
VKISVVICCYNSAARITDTLNYIFALDKRDFEIELIIVDNASVDNTEEVAWEQWDNSNLTQHGNISFKIVQELNAGLTFARRRGVMEAKGDFLIFVDDDNWLAPNYLTESVRLMKEFPNAAVIGGFGTPYFENGKKPGWFDHNEGYFAVGEQAANEGIITNEKGYVYGASSVWKREVLEIIFRNKLFLTDRIGAKLSSGGDTELCFRAVILGYDIIYSKRLRFFHFIPEGRLNLNYVIRLQKESIPNNYLLHGLMFKSGIQKDMFNSKIKRTWWGQIILNLAFLIKGRRTINECFAATKHLLELNHKYNKLFL